MAKKQDPKRREFLKKSAYAAPAILSLQAASALAKEGSVKDEKKGSKKASKKGSKKGSKKTPPKKKRP